METKITSFRHSIHQKIIDNLKEVKHWFLEKTKDKAIPFYSSFDIRNSHFKAACVDANIFPAGFNNICEEDQKRASSLIQDYLSATYPSVKKILLLSEEHTRNLYYWDNVFIIKTLIENGGYSVAVCVPGKQITSSQKIKTASGREIFIQLLSETKGDLIISNNDFSIKYDLPQNIPCIPPLKMGWNTRRKHDFFIRYNQLAGEFAEMIDRDPWHFQVKTEIFSPFDVTSRENLKKLTAHVTDFFKKLTPPEASTEKPYLFLKNNYGTYGLGITTVSDPEEVLQWNYKTRKDLKATKGGGGVRELILQEGIPSSLFKSENFSAEPVIYMVGSQPAGGFWRIHEKKDHRQNLNRPGVIYKPLFLSDQSTNDQKIIKTIYNWIGRLGFLAVGEELKQFI